MVCERCQGRRWICEAHTWKPFPHDACSGPGDPCPECEGDAKPPLPDDWVSIASTAEPAGGELVSVHVIPRPHTEVEKILPKGGKDPVTAWGLFREGSGS
jgi:hypothetical protein